MTKRQLPNPEQLSIVGVSSEMLNVHRGVVTIRPREVGLLLTDRSNITVLATRLGHMLGPRIEDSSVTDQQLDVYQQNFEQAEIETIESGLYFTSSDPGRKQSQQLIVINQQPVHYHAPGVVDRNTGVVFPEQEFRTVARSAKDLVRHTIAQARSSNSSNLNREELKALSFRAAAHAMDSKMKSMDNLRDGIVDNQRVLLRILHDADSIWRSHYKVRNLDKDRILADEMIHETAEVSALSYNLGTVAVNAMHRAITSRLYRSLTSKEIAQMWRDYTSMAGRYNNARLGKIFQSKADCYNQYAIYEPYLKTQTIIDKSTSV